MPGDAPTVDEALELVRLQPEVGPGVRAAFDALDRARAELGPAICVTMPQGGTVASTSVDDLRASVAELHERASLRELSQVLDVNHMAVYNLLQGRRLRPSTLRRLSQGLAGSREAEAFDRLLNAIGTLSPRGAGLRRRLEQRLASAAKRVFADAGEPEPKWVDWLSKGKRSPARGTESVEAWLATWTRTDRPMQEVVGRVVGTGGDGEPVLADCHTLGAAPAPEGRNG